VTNSRRLELLHERPVVGLWKFDAGEKVGDNAGKEHDVIRQKLGQVRIFEGAQHQPGLVSLGLLALVETCCGDYGIDRSHAKVVVVLRRQLLARQFEAVDHLFGQDLGLLEAEGKEAYLANKSVVGHHAGYGPKQDLQIVRKLRSSRIPAKRSTSGQNGVKAHPDPGFILMQEIANPALHCARSRMHTHPGFIVMNEAFSGFSGISVPSKTKRASLLTIAWLIVSSCCAITDSTSAVPHAVSVPIQGPMNTCS
jgi:hypothetical protein